MRIAVTGHMDLSEGSVELIRDDLLAHLGALGTGEGITGISCLARGADSVFAEAVLDSGGSLEVVLPSPHYREKKVKADHAPVFDRLIEEATHVHTLPFDEVNRDAYEAANELLIDTCDRLFAVWDGEAGRRSGTATVVEHARAKNLSVTVIWPTGASRTKK